MSKAELQQRIENLKDFVSDSQYPAPCMKPYGKQIDDLLAVAAGTKPIGLSSFNDGYAWRDIIDILKEHGVSVKTHKYWHGHGWEYDLIAASNPNDLSEIQKLFAERHNIDIKDYHIKLGRMLGYPESAIDNFLNRTKGQSNWESSEQMYRESQLISKIFGEFQKVQEIYERLISRKPVSFGIPFAVAEVGIGAKITYDGIKSLSASDKNQDLSNKERIQKIAAIITGVGAVGFGLWTARTAQRGSIKQLL